MRKSGKKLQLWVAADDQTTPVAGDAVAFVTGLNYQSRASVANVTAAGDAGARKVGGIPDASVRLTGRLDLTSGGSSQLLAAHQDQQPRNMTLVWDSDDADDGLDFTALVAEYSQSSQHTAPWDFGATLEIDGSPVEDRTV